MSDHAAIVQQLRWEAANLRAIPLWLIEQKDLDAIANRLEAVAELLYASVNPNYNPRKDVFGPGGTPSYNPTRGSGLVEGYPRGCVVPEENAYDTAQRNAVPGGN